MNCLNEKSTIKLVHQLLLDFEAIKYCCCQATSYLEEPSTKHHHPASHHEIKTVDLMSKTESIKDNLSELLHPTIPVCTVLSQIENEIRNIQVLLDHFITCLTDEAKAL
ncbi:predicted protein [Coccidioides posadasii str. Silveira]|uniref:Predicted protein n=1 Tax=Coccidioides posadasii (strain RMSCC 757 / Silveira) TaxID=443226 RepID=E9D759_COCPS|nr:predicted protein [Coccidioides posadasii str. Silveira]